MAWWWKQILIKYLLHVRIFCSVPSIPYFIFFNPLARWQPVKDKENEGLAGNYSID